MRTAFVPTVGGPVERSTLGGGLRDADNVVAYPLGDGGAGVAWLQPDANLRSRLYAAVPGGTRSADPPAPDVRVGRPRRTLLSYDQPLTLPVTCSAACDVRVQARSNQAEGTLSLSRAGRGTLRVGPRAAPIARASGGVVRLRLLYGAPGAAHPAARTLAVRLRARPLPPQPRAGNLRATRRPGDRIRVTWTIDRPAGRTAFLVSGLATRGGPTLTLNAAVDPTRRRRHFALVLGHVRGVRFVKLSTYAPGRPEPRTQFVRAR